MFSEKRLGRQVRFQKHGYQVGGLTTPRQVAATRNASTSQQIVKDTKMSPAESKQQSYNFLFCGMKLAK